jgi:hypothetical protein
MIARSERIKSADLETVEKRSKVENFANGSEPARVLKIRRPSGLGDSICRFRNLKTVAGGYPLTDASLGDDRRLIRHRSRTGFDSGGAELHAESSRLLKTVPLAGGRGLLVEVQGAKEVL